MKKKKLIVHQILNMDSLKVITFVIPEANTRIGVWKKNPDYQKTLSNVLYSLFMKKNLAVPPKNAEGYVNIY